jgi:hypothetical protein
MRRFIVLIASAVLTLPTQWGIAWAQSDPSLAPCEADAAHSGQLASCTYDVHGHITNITYNDPFGSGGDGPAVPGFVIPLFVVFTLIGLGVFLVKLGLARGMARQAGLDPSRAGWVTALSDDGLAATYLATAAPRTRATPTRAARLIELDELRSRGLITDAEHADRRAAVLGEI